MIFRYKISFDVIGVCANTSVVALVPAGSLGKCILGSNDLIVSTFLATQSLFIKHLIAIYAVVNSFHHHYSL